MGEPKRTIIEQSRDSEIWEFRAVVQHNTWGIFGLVAFKVILGSFGAPACNFSESMILKCYT